MSFENMLSDAAINKEDYLRFYRSILTLKTDQSQASL